MLDSILGLAGVPAEPPALKPVPKPTPTTTRPATPAAASTAPAAKRKADDTLESPGRKASRRDMDRNRDATETGGLAAANTALATKKVANDTLENPERKASRRDMEGKRGATEGVLSEVSIRKAFAKSATKEDYKAPAREHVKKHKRIDVKSDGAVSLGFIQRTI